MPMVALALCLSISTLRADPKADTLRKNLEEFDTQTRIDQSLTIADVAKLPANKQLGYILDVASRRGLELGIKHGDRVLNCLKAEFIGARKNDDGSMFIPRGMKAATQLIHRHNNNGGENRLAAKQIIHFVDLVAERACHVKL